MTACRLLGRRIPLPIAPNSSGPPQQPPPSENATKRLVTAKFTGVTSTVSLPSNSPVRSVLLVLPALDLCVVFGASGPASFRLSLIHSQ